MVSTLVLKPTFEWIQIIGYEGDHFEKSLKLNIEFK